VAFCSILFNPENCPIHGAPFFLRNLVTKLIDGTLPEMADCGIGPN
jgi:hypothetical protein